VVLFNQLVLHRVGQFRGIRWSLSCQSAQVRNQRFRADVVHDDCHAVSFDGQVASSKLQEDCVQNAVTIGEQIAALEREREVVASVYSRRRRQIVQLCAQTVKAAAESAIAALPGQAERIDQAIDDAAKSLQAALDTFSLDNLSVLAEGDGGGLHAFVQGNCARAKLALRQQMMAAIVSRLEGQCRSIDICASPDGAYDYSAVGSLRSVIETCEIKLRG